MFFAPFLQGPGCLSYVFFIACYVGTLITVDNATFLLHGVLVLGLHEQLFYCCVTLEVYLNAILTTYVVKAFSCSLCVWDDDLSYEVLVASCCICWACILIVGWFAWLLFVLPSSPWLLLRTLLCTLYMAWEGYLHFPIASLRCLISFSRSSGLVQTVFALWVSVPMTLYVADRLSWLSHCKYWSVWVGFWYTKMDREPSACGVTKVSRKGIAPFPCVPSTVNLISQSTWFMCSRNSCLLDCCWMTHVSSTNLYHTQGDLQQMWVIFLQNIPCTS